MKELGIKEHNPQELKEPLHRRAAVLNFSEEFTREAHNKRAKEMKDAGYAGIKFDLDVPTPLSAPERRKGGH